VVRYDTSPQLVRLTNFSQVFLDFFSVFLRWNRYFALLQRTKNRIQSSDLPLTKSDGENLVIQFNNARLNAICRERTRDGIVVCRNTLANLRGVR
jgi:hypothetical protein